jgi:hypothetical protein
MGGIRPEGAGAVMAGHAPAQVEADDAQTALYRKLEFFPTPPWAARAGGELIKRLDPLAQTCWEPACGQGHMAHGLADYFPGRVASSDVHDHGVGTVIDFLDPAARFPGAGDPDWIVTNPPFGAAPDFVRLGLARAGRGVAILARGSFLESARRYPLFFGPTPLSAYAPFFERVPMQLGVWDPNGSTATAYAWFVWLKPGLRDGAPDAPRVDPDPAGDARAPHPSPRRSPLRRPRGLAPVRGGSRCLIST